MIAKAHGSRALGQHLMFKRTLRDRPVLLMSLLLLFVFLVWLVSYFLLFYGLLPTPRKTPELDALANLGNGFQIIGALFAAFAFVGLIATVYFQSKQVEATLKSLEASANQQLFDTLQLRLEQAIPMTLPGTFKLYNTPGYLQAFRISARENKGHAETNAEYLSFVGGSLSQYVSVPDKFRRKNLFQAIESLFSRVTPDQATLFRRSLLAQIYDEAARSLILVAIADKDEELLTIYARLGINFGVLNEIPDLASEVKKRFAMISDAGD
jgi:hypothetical protein